MGCGSRGDDMDASMVKANTPAVLACALPPVASLPAFPAMPCWWMRHRTSASSTHRRKQQGIAIGIIE